MFHLRILFLGKSKIWSRLAFEYLLARGVKVSTVPNGVFDVGISYLYPNIIKPDTLRLPRLGFLNFHTAPLPDFRGVAGINFAILERLHKWGVSVHWMNETIDTGPIIEVRRFPINPDNETAYSLDFRAQTKLFQLYIDVVDKLLKGNSLIGKKQTGGRYVSWKEFEAAQIIYPTDSSELKKLKERAFYYPPHGAVFA